MQFRETVSRSVERIEPLLARHHEAALVIALTLCAAVPRLVLLTNIPPGLHGDEAWTGLDARRILSEGWIGPYVGSALGQPAGPLYFAAPFEKLLGPDVLAVRLPMAILATATIPASYFAFRLMFNRVVAAFGSALLAVSLWHLHYSRIGFMVISWPLAEMATLAFLFWGLRTGRVIPFLLAGLCFGAGVYTYNAYPVFALPVALLFAWISLRELAPHRQEGHPWKQKTALLLSQLLLFVVGSLVAAWPMIRYATDPQHGYLNHHRSVSVFESDEWSSKDLLGKARFSLDRIRTFYTAAFWRGQPDGADAAGKRPMVDRVSLALLGIGLVLVLRRWREPAPAMVLASFVLLPVSSEFTFNALFRRSLGLVPFISVLAALPLASLWSHAATVPAPWRLPLRGATCAVVAIVAFLSFNYYFGEFPDSNIARFTFAVEIAEASKYMRQLPDDTYIYFYSGRWSFDYETRRYLAPNLRGEDRSREFGTFDLRRESASPVAFVLLPPYTEYASEVMRLYPGGRLTDSVQEDGTFLFRVYYLPAQSHLSQIH